MLVVSLTGTTYNSIIVSTWLNLPSRVILIPESFAEGATEYTDCPGLLNQSSSKSPNSSVFEIAKAGIPLDKIVIGKQASASDADNGLMAPADLSKCVSQAKSSGWNGGIMFWEVCIMHPRKYNLQTDGMFTVFRQLVEPGGNCSWVCVRNEWDLHQRDLHQRDPDFELNRFATIDSHDHRPGSKSN